MELEVHEVKLYSCPRVGHITIGEANTVHLANSELNEVVVHVWMEVVL